jgi:single-stranded-DNA-specific exonuclease
MDRAVERLKAAIRQRQPILVWGDFDVDGQTSTALLVQALRDLGAVVRYHIPNRFDEGHGVHVPTLARLLDDALLLTCDTGIAAFEAADYVRGRGGMMIVTDHHALPERLPPVEAAINPMRLPEGHPLRELSGVGVAYKLVEALYGGRSTDHLLDLVAVGLVADVMVQTGDTRYLIQRGLAALRSAPRPGLRAMMARAEVLPENITERDIGFTLAPRLNALGRLADANPAVELLMTDDAAQIAERVNELEGLNQRRRFLTQQVVEAAQRQIEADPALLKYAALVIAGEGWPTGVLGIAASRLADSYGCPVALLSENDGLASGSARSVAGCDLVAALRSQSGLLLTFGGHNMAAGLSLRAENLLAFRRGFSGAVRQMLGRETVQPQLVIDAALRLPELTLSLADDLARLAPFGNGSPPPVLMTPRVRLLRQRALGQRGDHLELRVADEDGSEGRIVWWFGDAEAIPDGWFDVAYTLRASTYQGRREALIEWLDARPSPGEAAVVVRSRIEVVDERANPDPARALAAARQRFPDTLVWAEGLTESFGADRSALRPAAALAVVSPPPSPAVWRAALHTVQPQTVILLGQMPACDQPEALLKHVTGLLKYTLAHRGGAVSLSELAAQTGQTELTIRAALRWLDGHTPLRLRVLEGEQVTVEMGEARSGSDAAAAERLRRLLEETRAYRRYWLGAPVGLLGL